MKINIAEQLLPEVYNRHGKDCYLDPIRQKLIYITPEETVRQRMISYLVNELKVPKGAILVEEHLSHYNVPSKKRADIVVHGKKDETQYPVLIVECKAPDVFLDEGLQMQIVLKLGMLTIEEIETELMNNFQFLKLRNRNL